MEASGPRRKEAIELPYVDPVGIVRYPDEWTSGSSVGKSRPVVLVVAALFALITLATGAVSLGAYCLTSDGGDRRALDVAAPVEGSLADRPLGTVVVELFTSQGCSSCPPADRLLRELASDPDLALRLVPLALHVDYWNYIGWTDPFSSERWSDRQREYARVMNESRIYTPQLVVDGRAHFVGSNEGEVRRALQRALARPDEVSVQLSVDRGAGPLTIDVEARHRDVAIGAVTVWAAIWEDGLSTPIARGENGGRTLSNDRVVRLLRPVATLGEGESTVRGRLEVSLDPDWQPDRLGVAVFAQRVEDLAVLGAASAAP